MSAFGPVFHLREIEALAIERRSSDQLEPGCGHPQRPVATQRERTRRARSPGRVRHASSRLEKLSMSRKFPVVIFTAAAAGIFAACSDAASPTAVPRAGPPSMAANGDGSLAVTSVIGLEPIDQALNQSAASSNDATGQHAVIWDNSPFPELLPTPGGTGASVANAINNSGTIVGHSTFNGNRTATRWVKVNGTWVGIPGASSEATDINGSGEVSGTARTSSGGKHAFLWTSKKGLIDLGTLGGSSSFGNAISIGGQIVGVSVGRNGLRATKWTLK